MKGIPRRLFQGTKAHVLGTKENPPFLRWIRNYLNPLGDKAFGKEFRSGKKT